MRALLRASFAVGCLGCWGICSATSYGAEKLAPAAAAAQADRLLLAELTAAAGNTPERSGPCDDETYLRRVSLDSIGELPSPEQVTAFVLDPATDKRSRLVERLLADERFGQNWARYWRDVILYRRSDDRALISAEALQQYLTAAFNDGTPWDDIATAFVTATGDVRENGQTALIMAQMGAAEETTAEVARIFLGIQIQCAQCHDHPTDRWKRTEFHELAAFFPRIAVRPVRDPEKRTFEVVSVDRDPRRRPNGNQRRGSAEHYMPDLADPTARGTLMQPTFFVTHHRVDEGKTDQERRTILANLMTGESNPWFDRAFVNRIWSELVGEGFYEPVDDMGPDRQCAAPETLDLLATQFRANGRDVKWLYRTVAATAVYGLDSRSRREPDEAPFAANCLQRLRADQLMGALGRTLGVSFDQGRGSGPYGGMRGLQGQFVQTFGFDPSEPRDEMAGSIPQALLMMNSPILARALNAYNVNTALGRLLAENADDETVVVELYLRSLAREPSDAELTTCLDYVREIGDRREAFEDLQWALVNSTEFLHRK